MYRLSRNLAVPVLLSLLAVVTLACAAKSPEEKVAKIRSLYTARLNGFIVQEVPAEPVAPEGDAGEPSEAEEGEEMEPMAPPTQNVLLDVLLQHDSYDKLSGVTVDISMVDHDRNEVGHWRAWFDTSSLEKATGNQVTHVLEDVDYVEGYGFDAEVRPVPEAERGDYAEFSGAGSQ